MRTVDGDAKDGEDYEGIDEEVKFNNKDSEAEVAVKIIDDDRAREPIAERVSVPGPDHSV